MNEDQFQLYSHIFAKSFQIERGTPHAYHALYLSGQGVGKPHFPLFFLLGVESEERSTPGILQNIARAILSQAQTETISGEMQLIGICRYLNEYLVAVTRKPKAWCKRLQILIVAIDEEMLYLAAYGNVRAYLSRKRKFTDVVRAGAPLTPDRETHVNIPSKSQRSP